MTEGVMLLGMAAVFAAGFGIGVLNMAHGDPLGMRYLYRAVGLMPRA